jgi:hypothetical protein
MVYEEVKSIRAVVKRARQRQNEGVPCHGLMMKGKIVVQYDCLPPELVPFEDTRMTLEEAAKI